MTTLRIAAITALLVPAAVCAQQDAPRGNDSGAVERAAGTITERDYMRRVGVIAHDSMRGRETPSPDLDRAAAWIAAELQGMGLRGGAEDGGFIQRYPLRAVVVDAEASYLEAGGARLALGPDFVPQRRTNASGQATAELVLVSGTTRLGSAVEGAVRGRHAVVVPAAAAGGLDRATFQVVATLAGAGVASVSVVSAADDARWAEASVDALRPAVDKAWGDAAVMIAPDFRPVLQIRAASLERLLAGRGVDLAALARRAGEPVRVDAVGDLEATLSVRTRIDTLSAPNVVAVVEGSDPALAGEYVVFSAHMDHVGVGAPDERGDSIFNGADDDASGTVAVMEVAEAMASLPTPPRRSMVFLLVSGEENGLWGSEWYADHPTAPVDRLVANLNADMVGRNWPDTIVAIGKEHSDLGRTLERVNSAHPELGMTAIDDLWPEEQFYFRSDHYNFARKGVPILFFFNGTHDDYHGRDDEPDRIDGEKAARIARLLFYLGMEIADADQRPVWNPESRARIVSDGS